VPGLHPDDPSSKDFVFHAGVLPAPPAALTTDRIVFRKLYHDYNGWYRADALWMYLTPQKCRDLGVFLLACAFHGPAETTTLTLSHPKSEIRRISIFPGKLRLDDLPVGLSEVPFAFRYFPAETEKHPWLYDGYQPHELPCLALSNIDDAVGPTEEHWKARDTVWVCGGSPGTFRLAELLLNAGCPWNPVREYALEGDAGYRGVAPMSAELRIFLPEADGWIYGGDEGP